MPLNAETIYIHVWRDKRAGGDLWRHLRQATKKRRKRYGAYDSRGRVAGKRHISERPPEVEERIEVGHWEIDTVMGTEHGRNSVITLVERATGYTVMGKLAASLRRRRRRPLRRAHRTSRRPRRDDHRRQRHRVPQLQADRGRHRCRVLLRHPAPLLGARHEREHERAHPPVPAEADEPGPRHPGRLRRDRRQAQLTAEEAARLPDTGGML